MPCSGEGREEPQALSDPEFELRLGREKENEKLRSTGIDGMRNTQIQRVVSCRLSLGWWLIVGCR